MRNFKVGDKVKFNTNDLGVIKKELNKWSGYVPSVKKRIDKIGIILDSLDNSENELVIDFDDGFPLLYPVSLLEKVNIDVNNNSSDYTVDDKIKGILIKNEVDKYIFGIGYSCLVDDLVTLFEDLQEGDLK